VIADEEVGGVPVPDRPVEVAEADVEIDLSAFLVVDEVADSHSDASAPTATAGGSMTYTGTVSNQGNVTLTNVIVVDTQASPSTTTSASIATMPTNASAKRRRSGSRCRRPSAGDSSGGQFRQRQRHRAGPDRRWRTEQKQQAAQRSKALPSSPRRSLWKKSTWSKSVSIMKQPQV